MALLDDLAPGMMLKGIRSQTTVTLLAVTCHGAESAEIIFKDAAGSLGSRLVYRADTNQFEVVPASLPWPFTADGAAFRLVSEAYRIAWNNALGAFTALARRRSAICGIWSLMRHVRARSSRRCFAN